MASVYFMQNYKCKPSRFVTKRYSAGDTHDIGNSIDEEKAAHAVALGVARYTESAITAIEKPSAALDDKSYEPSDAQAIEPAPKKKRARKKKARTHDSEA